MVRETLCTYSDITATTPDTVFAPGDTVYINGIKTSERAATTKTVKLEIYKDIGDVLQATPLNTTYSFVANTPVTYYAINSNVMPLWAIDLAQATGEYYIKATTGSEILYIPFAIAVTTPLPYDIQIITNKSVIAPTQSLTVSLLSTMNTGSASVLHTYGIYRKLDDSLVKSYSHSVNMTLGTPVTHTTIGLTTAEMTLYNSGLTMSGEYYVSYGVSGGTPECDSVVNTARFYMGSPTSDSPPTLTGLLFNPTQPTTNQDCGVTVTYRDDNNDAPLSAVLKIVDSLLETSLYAFTTSLTDYDGGIQYRSNIPAGSQDPGIAQCTAYFTNANGYASATGSIHVSNESILTPITDPLNIIHELLENKAEKNYQLIKNTQGIGAINRTQIRRYKPTDEGHLPCIWIEEVDSSLLNQTGDFADCEDLDTDFFSTTFDVWIIGTPRTELTYNAGNYKGWAAVELLTNIAMRILKENQTYTSSTNSNHKLYFTRLNGKAQLEEDESQKTTRFSRDAIGYRLRYTSSIRVDR
jgi:hypothetical protein